MLIYLVGVFWGLDFVPVNSNINRKKVKANLWSMYHASSNSSLPGADLNLVWTSKVSRERR